MINFNVPAVKGFGGGSGIFLHVSQGGSTVGGVALPRRRAAHRVLRRIDGSTRIVMAPDDTIRRLLPSARTRFCNQSDLRSSGPLLTRRLAVERVLIQTGSSMGGNTAYI